MRISYLNLRDTKLNRSKLPFPVRSADLGRKQIEVSLKDPSQPCHTTTIQLAGINFDHIGVLSKWVGTPGRDCEEDTRLPYDFMTCTSQVHTMQELIFGI